MKRLAWVVLILGLVFVTAVVLFVVEPWRHDETTGLTLIDSWKTDYRSSPPPDRWRQLVADTPAEESKRNPNLEMIRFVYQTNFYPRVCISAWKDTDECWIRSTVCREHPELDEFKLWQKTKPLPVAEWNHLRTLLQQKSIADPLNGAVPPSEFTGLYGTCWYLQSSIGGKTTSARVDNPLWPADCRSFEKIESQKPIVADFVDTCQLLLKLGDVRVPRMY